MSKIEVKKLIIPAKTKEEWDIVLTKAEMGNRPAIQLLILHNQEVIFKLLKIIVKKYEHCFK